MDSAHRKIDLQSPADLTYLTTRLRTTASQKLDLHLPPVDSASEPDDLRKNVETLVTAFVDEIVRGMRSNVAVNGMDVVRADDEDRMEGIEGANGSNAEEAMAEVEEFAPYDEKLRTQLGNAIARRDALVAKISAHRRETAAKAAEAWKAGFERESEAVLNSQRDGGVGELDAGADEIQVELKRAEEVQRNWERAIEGLQMLNKGLPETRARLERAGGVVGYLGGK